MSYENVPGEVPKELKSIGTTIEEAIASGLITSGICFVEEADYPDHLRVFSRGGSPKLLANVVIACIDYDPSIVKPILDSLAKMQIKGLAIFTGHQCSPDDCDPIDELVRSVEF